MYRPIQYLSLGCLLAATLLNGGCGLHPSCFITPVYRLPSGYSETYREHLAAETGAPAARVLLDPELAILPAPVPPPELPLRPVSPVPLVPDGAPNGRGSNGRMPFPPKPTPEKTGPSDGSTSR